MSGLDKNMLLVIECLAKNRIQDAKKAAIACCANDTTKKNQRQINYCKNLLNTGSLELTTLPASLQGLIHIQDVSDFPENRYYVGTVQRQLYDKIYAGTQVAYRLADYAISYDEELQMIQKFIKDIDALELDTDLQNYAKENHSQAETVDYLTEKLGSLLLQDILAAEKKCANQ